VASLGFRVEYRRRMNRSDLKWALDAVLPHVGKTAQTNVVGLEQSAHSFLTVYATDRYTIATASCEAGPNVDVRMTSQEARELLRFIRPSLKAHEEQEVVMLDDHVEHELHVAHDDDSAVFEMIESPINLHDLNNFMTKLWVAAEEYQHLIFWPRLFGRFAKAERHETDRLVLSPRHTSDHYGAALVNVGEHFHGAIVGMEYAHTTQEEQAA
jgi:hypothetical protein